MKNLSDDASLPQTQQELMQEIARIDEALAENDAALRTLLAQENPVEGIYYAQDIHNMRQEKLILLTRKALRETRIRRILAGFAQ